MTHTVKHIRRAAIVAAATILTTGIALPAAHADTEKASVDQPMKILGISIRLPESSSSSRDALTQAKISSDEQKIVDEINDFRVSKGLSKLDVTARDQEAAYSQAGTSIEECSTPKGYFGAAVCLRNGAGENAGAAWYGQRLVERYAEIATHEDAESIGVYLSDDAEHAVVMFHFK